MAEGRLAPAEITQQEHFVSAPSSADFYFPEGLEQAAQQSVAEIVLESDAAYGEGDSVSAIFGLKDELSPLLKRYREKYEKNSAAADYAGYYREELLGFPSDGLTQDQEAALMVAQVYLSSLESLGQLGKFIETGKWTGQKSQASQEAKVTYLAARKKFQDDVDDYFDHFAAVSSESLYQTLVDTINLARLTISGKQFVDAETDNHTHVFLGSVLSERAVKASLQKSVHPGARYGTEDEDKSPTKADIVFPIRGGDMYVQVKMKWTKPTQLKVQPKKTPPHVIVPMQYIRGYLTGQETAKVAEIISAAAERKELQLQIDEALALGGLRKYRALLDIPIMQFRDWWSETKAVVQNDGRLLGDNDVMPLQQGIQEFTQAP